MAQQKKPQKRKKKKDQKLEFDPAKVFDVEASTDLELGGETSRYKARKGQGGDRRK